MPSSIHRGLRYNFTLERWYKEKNLIWRLPSSIHRGLRYNNTLIATGTPICTACCRPLFIEAFDTTHRRSIRLAQTFQAINVAVLYSSRPSIQQEVNAAIRSVFKEFTEARIRFFVHANWLPSSIHRGLRYNEFHILSERQRKLMSRLPSSIHRGLRYNYNDRILDEVGEEEISCRPLFIEAFDTTQRNQRAAR